MITHIIEEKPPIRKDDIMRLETELKRRHLNLTQMALKLPIPKVLVSRQPGSRKGRGGARYKQ